MKIIIILLIIVNSPKIYASTIQKPFYCASIITYASIIEKSKSDIYSVALKDDVGEIEKIKAEIAEIKEELKNERERYSVYSSYITATVLSIFAIILSGVGYLFVKENFYKKRVIGLIEDEVIQRFNLSDGMFAEIKKRIHRYFESYKYYITLKVLLSQNHPIKEDVYACLTAMIATPEIEYLSLIEKLIALNIDSEITEKAIYLLNKIKKLRK